MIGRWFFMYLLAVRASLGFRSFSLKRAGTTKLFMSATRLVAPSTAEERKGKVLMIHGWAQNAVVMRNKTRGMTKKLNQAGYDCVFMEGPHVLPAGDRENARAWFLLSETDPGDASLSQSGIPMTYIGVDQSLAIIEKELLEEDCFVAVLGFSQGGVFCHILSALAMQSEGIFSRIKCCIIANGFAAQHVSAKNSTYNAGNLQSMKITLPSLHVIGEKDERVRPKLSFDLANNVFEQSEVLLHEKGHLLPQNSAQCATMVSFLDRNRERDTNEG